MDEDITSYIMSSDYQDIPTDKEKKYKLAKLINKKKNEARKMVLTPTDKDDEVTFHRKIKAKSQKKNI